LPVARGDVVRTRVAEDVVQCLVDGDVLTVFSDDDREFHLVVHLLGDARLNDRVQGPGCACGRLQEYDRVLWVRQLELVSVLAVVEADAHDCRRHHWRKQPAHGRTLSRVAQRSSERIALSIMHGAVCL